MVVNSNSNRRFSSNKRNKNAANRKAKVIQETKDSQITKNIRQLLSIANKKVIGKITYFPDKILGKGIETKVFHGLLNNEREVAVKRIGFDQPDKDKTIEEINILVKCDKHENIVTYFTKEITDEHIFIALELCNFSLEEWISQKGSVLAEPIEKTEILRQVTTGLEYLHDNNIIHRDLKPENVLVSLLEGEKVRVKITDFGISKQLPEGRTSKTVLTTSGTMGWMAPEILRVLMNLDENHTETAKMNRGTDIFSLGCLFYYVLTNGTHAFGNNSVEIQYNITYNYKQCLDLFKMDIAHVGSIRLIQQMLAKNSKERPSAKAVLSHHLFWSQAKSIQFLVDVSNALEIKPLEGALKHCKTVADKNYSKILYNSWNLRLTHSLQQYIRDNKYRNYDYDSVMDLIRAIRNLRGHHASLPKGVKRDLGNFPGEFQKYWQKRFPFLVDHTWTNFQQLRNKPEYGLTSYYLNTNDFWVRKPNDEEQLLFDKFLGGIN